MTTVGGNADVTRCTENALRLLHAFGADDVPVAEGAAGALLGSVVRATEVHGESGIGDTRLDPATSAVHPGHAVDLIASLLAAQPGAGGDRAHRAAHEHRAAAAAPPGARRRGSRTCA